MANFCRFCGSPLEEGQTCSCQAAQSSVATETPVAPAAAPAAPAAPSLFVRLKEVLVGYLKQPKLTAAAVAADAKGMALAGILAGINALAIFLYIWKFFGGIFGPIEQAMGALGGLASGMSGMNMPAPLEYPIVVMLLSGIILAAVGVAISALIVFVAGKINKQEVDFKKLVMVEATHTIVPSVLLLAGIILGFIGLGAQLIVLALILVLWIITVRADCNEFAGTQATENFKTLALQTVFVTVGLAVAVWLISTIAGWCLNETKIMGFKIGDALKAIGSLGDLLGGALEEIMGDLVGDLF